MNRNYPRFAVVGHPNKGKSSIVATLAHDESVQISNIPGTTTKQRAFPLKIDGKTLYELYDTPGFQRARALLGWLQAKEIPASQKAQRVKQFLAEHKDNPKFQDEIELLEPIMNGAGIIYVVDGSKPYGVEYEAQMEILRYTGQPSMALINLIDETDYVDEWKQALGQYFRLVRVFNPMRSNFAQHIALLESMAQLKEEWTPLVKESIEVFKSHQKHKIEESARLISELMLNSLGHKSSLAIKGEKASDEEKQALLEKYKSYIRKLEEKTQQKIAKVWRHESLEKEASLPLFEEIDLFSKESESIFGLGKKELIATGAGAGAGAGATIDLMVAGSSFMLGSAIGGLLGGVGAAFGFGKMFDMKLLGQKIGSKNIEIGPIKASNFAYILLGRILYYSYEIASRPHANRSKLTMQNSDLKQYKWFGENQKKELERVHKSLQEEKSPKEKERNIYQDILMKALSDSLNLD